MTKRTHRLTTIAAAIATRVAAAVNRIPRRGRPAVLGVLTLAAVAAVAFVAVVVAPGGDRTAARGTSTNPAVQLTRVHAAAARPDVDGRLALLAVGSDDGAPSFGRHGRADRGRGDSLHLLVIDADATRGVVIGIPRDAYVPIPGRAAGKINSALATGGPDLLVRAVEDLSGITVDYYALTHFEGLVTLVNGVGGVPVDVTRRIEDPASGADLHAGPQRLNGRQALAYARARKTVPGGDFARSRHQGQLLIGGLGAFQGHLRADPAALMKWLALIRRTVVTDLPMDELMRLALLARDVNPADLHNVVLPGTPGTAGEASVVRLTPEADAILASVRAGRLDNLDNRGGPAAPDL